MRKIALLAIASLLMALLVPTVVFAEHNAQHVRAGSDGSPNNATPPTEGVPQECSDFANPQTAQELDQDFGLNCASPSPSPSPTASPAASQYASALPETGGGPPALGLAAMALLTFGGLMAVRLVRRS